MSLVLFNLALEKCNTKVLRTKSLKLRDRNEILVHADNIIIRKIQVKKSMIKMIRDHRGDCAKDG